MPVDKQQKYLYPLAAIWHEGISGRKKENITSTFYKFFMYHKNAKSVKLWLDNCSGQNKNWGLFSFFIFLINLQEVATENIELAYFEPGHTFMSAYHFHHAVEKQMKEAKNVYNFQDFH